MSSYMESSPLEANFIDSLSRLPQDIKSMIWPLVFLTPRIIKIRREPKKEHSQRNSESTSYRNLLYMLPHNKSWETRVLLKYGSIYLTPILNLYPLQLEGRLHEPIRFNGGYDILSFDSFKTYGKFLFPQNAERQQVAPLNSCGIHTMAIFATKGQDISSRECLAEEAGVIFRSFHELKTLRKLILINPFAIMQSVPCLYNPCRKGSDLQNSCCPQDQDDEPIWSKNYARIVRCILMEKYTNWKKIWDLLPTVNEVKRKAPWSMPEIICMSHEDWE
jgi:hypothetical protein